MLSSRGSPGLDSLKKDQNKIHFQLSSVEDSSANDLSALSLRVTLQKREMRTASIENPASIDATSEVIKCQ